MGHRGPHPPPQIWVHSAHNASGYFTVYGDESLQSDHFSSRLSFGDTQTIWARTGYLGFLRRTELTDANGGECGPVGKGCPPTDRHRGWFRAPGPARRTRGHQP